MIRIITDSAADFEPQELQRLNLACIGLQVRFEDKEYTDGQDLTKKRFYELLLASRDLPKTSQASPQVLLDLLQEARDAGDEAIYITISSGISGTYQTACMSAGMTDWDGCHILDSRNATFLSNSEKGSTGVSINKTVADESCRLCPVSHVCRE